MVPVTPLASHSLLVFLAAIAVLLAVARLLGRLAERIGIRHRIVATDEFADPNYIRNDGTRCYYCKSELYGRIEQLLPELDADVICQSKAPPLQMRPYRNSSPGAVGHRVDP